jgi:hypothetical protein
MYESLEQVTADVPKQEGMIITVTMPPAPTDLSGKGSRASQWS